MSFVVALRDATDAPGVGGKAAGLARLLAAGLPVPDGFVVPHTALVAVVGELPDPTAWRARVAATVAGPGPVPDHPMSAVAARIETADLPAALAAEVLARAAELGGLLAVRSSVSIEDRAGGSAAGVLASRIAVAPDAVWPAIRAVWASACTPVVVEYALRHGAAALEVGVIVHRFVAGDAITIYTRPPGAPARDEVWIEPAAGVTVQVPRASTDPRAILALAAETAIGAARGADVELVAGEDGALAVVQARAIVHPRPIARVPAPPALLAPLIESGLRWQLDVEHNPDPVSVAQAQLVAAVDAARVAPWRICTVAGYIYAADVAVAAAARAEPTAPTSARLLRERFAALEDRMRDALATAADAPTVAAAVAAYVAFYAVWAGEVAPMLALARAGGRGEPGEGSPIARAIADAAAGTITRDDLLDRIGDLALAWDVAAPTLRESAWLVDAAIAAARATPPPPRPTRPSPPGLVAVALELGEVDDLWFARAQAMVRRAVLAAGARLGLGLGDDAFWLPLAELDGELDPVAAAARAAAARSARDRALGWDMPRVPGEPAAIASGVGWRGVGRGRAAGRVKRLAGATVVPPGTIGVARAITPALALLVPGAAALVSETGGILAHGASIARELGIPYVVGCTGIFDEIADGDRVEVDGDAGVVRRVED